MVADCLAGALGGAIATAQWGLEIQLPFQFLWGIFALHLAVVLHGWWRTRGKQLVASNKEVAVNLALDVTVLTLLLYLSGGWTNPLVGLYLVPLAIAAATLKAWHTWLLCALTICCYSLLTRYFQPLPHIHSAHMSDFSLHVMGMWLTFLISAVIIAYFVVRMAGSLRSSAERLALAREKNLRNEQLIGLATLAGGAAHELGTPLSTIAIVASELERENLPDEVRQDLAIIASQVQICKEILQRMTNSARAVRAEKGELKPLTAHVDWLVERWRLMRPSARLAYSPQSIEAGPDVVMDVTLIHAIFNLLNNAADVSDAPIELQLDWTPSRIVLHILDRGPGLTPELLAQSREVGTTSKAQGMGVGLMLVNATIEQLGGQVVCNDREGGGAIVSIILPISAISTR